MYIIARFAETRTSKVKKHMQKKSINIARGRA
jgi:hypothetical protein